MSIHSAKAVHAKMTRVIPDSIKFRSSVGRDDVYIGKTVDGETVMGIIIGLRKSAPKEVKEWMRNRMITNLTGRCPLCDACISATNQIASEVRHEDDCILIGEPDFVSRWIR